MSLNLLTRRRLCHEQLYQTGRISYLLLLWQVSHKLSGLKWNKFIILKIWRSEGWNQSQQANISRAAVFLNDQAVKAFPCLLWLRQDARHPWLMAWHHANLFSSHILISDSNPPTSFCKAPHDIIGPTCMIQDHLISRWWLNHQFPFVKWGIVFTNSRNWDVDFSGGRALCSLIQWCYKSSRFLPWPNWPTPMTNLCCNDGWRGRW